MLGGGCGGSLHRAPHSHRVGCSPLQGHTRDQKRLEHPLRALSYQDSVTAPGVRSDSHEPRAPHAAAAAPGACTHLSTRWLRGHHWDLLLSWVRLPPAQEPRDPASTGPVAEASPARLRGGNGVQRGVPLGSGLLSTHKRPGEGPPGSGPERRASALLQLWPPPAGHPGRRQHPPLICCSQGADPP